MAFSSCCSPRLPCCSGMTQSKRNGDDQLLTVSDKFPEDVAHESIIAHIYNYQLAIGVPIEELLSLLWIDG